jgi:putative redox protein
MADKNLKVDVVLGQGMSLMAKANSNHWVAMDGPAEFGGSSAGTRPIELFLMGLAGCTSMDVIAILQKKRVPYTDFKVEATTEREDEHPKVFKSVNIHFKVYGKGIREKDVARAIELSSEKYCAASAMLKKALPVTTSYEIIEPE